MASIEIKDDKIANNIDKYPNGEKVVGAQTFVVNTTFLGDVYINGRPYRQLCFTPNQVALAIEDFLNGEDYDDGEEEHNMKNKEE